MNLVFDPVESKKSKFLKGGGKEEDLKPPTFSIVVTWPGEASVLWADDQQNVFVRVRSEFYTLHIIPSMGGVASKLISFLTYNFLTAPTTSGNELIAFVSIGKRRVGQECDPRGLFFKKVTQSLDFSSLPVIGDLIQAPK
eukprot:Awhi_evm2s5726